MTHISDFWEYLPLDAREIRRCLDEAPARDLYARVVICSVTLTGWNEETQATEYVSETEADHFPRIVDARVRKGVLEVKCLRPADNEQPLRLWFPAKQVMRSR